MVAFVIPADTTHRRSLPDPRRQSDENVAVVSVRRSSEDRRRVVGGGVGMAVDDGLRPRHERSHLRLGGAGERSGVGDKGVELRPVEREARVAGDPVEQIVVGRRPPRAPERRRHRVLLDDLVRLLPADPRPDRGEQHLGGGEERELAVAARASITAGKGAELVEHRDEGLEQAVGGEERIGERDPANHRARHVALVPLVARPRRDTMVTWPDSTTARPVMRSHDRVFILWGIAEEPTWPGANPRSRARGRP